MLWFFAEIPVITFSVLPHLPLSLEALDEKNGGGNRLAMESFVHIVGTKVIPALLCLKRGLIGPKIRKKQRVLFVFLFFDVILVFKGFQLFQNG